MGKGFENTVSKFFFKKFETLGTTVTYTNNEKNNECPSLHIMTRFLATTDSCEIKLQAPPKAAMLYFKLG